MTPGPVEVATLAVTAGLGAAAVLAVAARRLREPDDHPEKVLYRRLGAPAPVIGCGLTGMCAMGLAALTLPLSVLPLWWVLAAVGVPLVTIDARTTWLPLVLTRISWAAMVSTLVGATLLGGWPLAGRSLVGATAAGMFFWLVWRISRGAIGYGDVRLAPLLGAATAAGSWSLLAAGLWLGSVAGAAYAVFRLLRRRTGPFAYAPAMMIGPYAAAVILRLW